MDIYVDIRGFLKIHVWICYGLSDQGCYVKTVEIVLVGYIVRKSSQNILFSKRFLLDIYRCLIDVQYSKNLRYRRLIDV